MHQYAVFEPVSAYGNLWDGELLNVSVTRDHCSNRIYDWGFDFTSAEQAMTGGLHASDIKCIPFDRRRHVLVDSSKAALLQLPGKNTCTKMDQAKIFSQISLKYQS